MGIDYCLPENTPVHALFDGEVVIAVIDAGDTLYGHLTVANATQHKVGDFLKKGQKIAELANYPENGNWVPHLHFQIMLSILNYKIDFPGVAYHRQINIWKSLCPDWKV